MLLCFLQWRDDFRTAAPWMKDRRTRTLYALTDLCDLFPLTEKEMARIDRWIEHHVTMMAPND